MRCGCINLSTNFFTQLICPYFADLFANVVIAQDISWWTSENIIKSQTVPEIKSNKRQQFARWIERKQEGHSRKLMELLNLHFFTMVSWSGQELISLVLVQRQRHPSHFQVGLDNLIIEKTLQQTNFD